MKFTEAISHLSDGEVEARLDEALDNLIIDLLKTQKEGSITLVLTMKPNGAESVSLGAKVTSKNPVQSVFPTTFFVTDDAQLSTRNPRQRTFDFKRGEPS